MSFRTAGLMLLMSLRSFAADPFEIVTSDLPMGKPLAELPSGIPSVAGKVTLHADYARAAKSAPIDVYLINRSDHDITLGSQDGDVYLKLEAANADGIWKRVQPHAFSWCGNSYDFRPVIQKNCFYLIPGHQPKAGTGRAAKIRFRLYMQDALDLATQAGQGMMSDKEAELAATDALSVYTGSFEFVRDLATGTRHLVNKIDHIQDMQGLAIGNLGSGRFPKEKVLPLLDEIEKKFPDRKDDVHAARQGLERPLEKK